MELAKACLGSEYQGERLAILFSFFATNSVEQKK